MADKGVAMVVVDKHDYLNKTQELLTDRDTYRTIPGDPTNREKIKCIQTLRNIKAQGGLNEYTNKDCTQPMVFPTKLYALSKVHKQGLPLRSIVSRKGAVIYEVAKKLATIIWPLVGQFPHHIRNTQHIMEHVKFLQLQKGDAWSPMRSRPS